MKEDKKVNGKIFIDALTDALGRSDEQSIEEVKNDLRDEGIEVEETMEKLITMVKNISMAAKRKQLDIAKEKRQITESKKLDFVSKFNEWTKDEILSRIKEISSLMGTNVSVAYRDLDSTNIDDLKSLLEDMEIAKQQYECEKDSNEE